MTLQQLLQMPQMKSTHRGWTRVHQRQLCMLEICCLLMRAQAKFILARTSLFDLSQWSSGFLCSLCHVLFGGCCASVAQDRVFMGIRYTPVYPIPYLCRHLKIYINFFTLNHHRPFAEITCSQILLSQQMVGLIITWCLPPTTPWLHASGVTFFHAVRSNASAAR